MFGIYLIELLLSHDFTSLVFSNSDHIKPKKWKITIFARNVSPDKSKSYFKSSEIPLYTANKSNRARKLKTFLCHLSIFGPKKKEKVPNSLILYGTILLLCAK